MLPFFFCKNISITIINLIYYKSYVNIYMYEEQTYISLVETYKSIGGFFPYGKTVLWSRHWKPLWSGGG